MIQSYIYMYLFFFKFFSHLGYYRILTRVPCAIQQVLVGYLFHIQQWECVNPKLPVYPSHPPFPPGNLKSVLKSQLYLHFPLTQHYPIFYFIPGDKLGGLPTPCPHIYGERGRKRERCTHTYNFASYSSSKYSLDTYYRINMNSVINTELTRNSLNIAPIRKQFVFRGR